MTNEDEWILYAPLIHPVIIIIMRFQKTIVILNNDNMFQTHAFLRIL